MNRRTKVGSLRVVAALSAGPLLGLGFSHLFCRVAPDACELMFVFVGRTFGLGYGGAFDTDVVTMSAIALTFSILCWFVLRGWGPLRHTISRRASAAGRE